MANIEIYKSVKNLESFERRIRDSALLTGKNKEIIFNFEHYIISVGLSKFRVMKYLEILKLIGEKITKDFDTVTKEDTMNFVKYIRMREDLSPWTQQSYCVILKRFYKWLYSKDESYPPEVSWIKTNLNKQKLKLPGEGDLITEEEIKKVFSVLKHPREKAFIALLFESGCRIGEIATLKLKHIVIDYYGIQLTIFGKTGSRKIRIISASSFLLNWLNVHPLQNDKEAPLWISIGIGKKTRDSFLSYQGLVKCLKKAFQEAGINKRIYPHLFRHSRATLMAKHLTEFQMNQYFGWVQGSDMAATYVHLSGRDMDTALLKFNGISTEDQQKEENTLKPRICPRCDTINSYDSSYCKKCTAILDEKLLVEIEEKKERRQDMDKVMDLLMKDPEFKEMILRKLMVKSDGFIS